MTHRRIAVPLACALLAIAAPAAQGSASPRYALFSGSGTGNVGGTATRCTEIVHGTIAPFGCDASFTFTADVCNDGPQQRAALFDYFSRTTGFSMVDVLLSSTTVNGAGYLVGHGVIGSRVFNIRISIAALCDDQSGGPFEGHLAYI